MIIMQHSSPKHLLRALSSIQPLFNGIDTRMQEFIVSWPAALSIQLATFAPQLLTKEKVRIVIAGVEQESTFKVAYQLLNRMLGTSISFDVHLIGPNLQPYSQPILLNPKYQDSSISVHCSNLTLGKWIDQFGLPDLVSLNQPGFDSHASEWLEADNGVERAVTGGSVVCGGSYGHDEHILDGFFLEHHGFKMVNPNTNHLAVKAIPNPGQHIPSMVKKAMDRGEMDAMRTIWQIDNERISPNSEGLERFHRGALLVEKGLRCLHWQGTIPQSVIQEEGHLNPLTLFPYLVNQRRVFVMGPLVYDFDTLSVYAYNDTSQTPLIEDIDYTHAKGNINTFQGMAEFLLSIHEDHLQHIIGEAIETLDHEGADMVDDQYNDSMAAEDLESIFEEDVLDPAITSFFKMLDTSHLLNDKPDPKMDSEETDEDGEHFRENLVAEISSLTKEEIQERDKQALCSAVCFAAMGDDVGLAKTLHEKGIDFNSRSLGKHSCLDIASTTGSHNFLRYCLENNLVSDVINSFDDEHTALHYAAIAGDRVAYDLLVANGADTKQLNAHGNSAESIMARLD